MSIHPWLASALGVATLLLSQARAEAQQTPPPYQTPSEHGAPYARTSNGFASQTLPPVRFYGGARVGVGGTYQFEYEDDDYVSDEGDLDATLGLQLGAGYVWRYFGIGGEFRANFFKPDDAPDREKSFDLVVKPRGGYQLRGIPLEFYGAVPVGISIPRFSDENDFDVNVGATVGLLAGVSYFFTRNVGINAELGWMVHVFGFEDTDGDRGVLALQQFSPLAVNVVFAL